MAFLRNQVNPVILSKKEIAVVHRRDADSAEGYFLLSAERAESKKGHPPEVIPLIRLQLALYHPA